MASASQNRKRDQRQRVLESMEITNTTQIKPMQSKLGSTKPQTKYVNTISVDETCIFCGKQHQNIFKCEKFSDKTTLSERYQTVNQSKACHNCLKANHQKSTCKSGNCKICNKKHHTLLHETSVKPSQENESTKIITHTRRQPEKIKILLSTAIIYIQDSAGNKHKCRALLDSGSDSNLITESLTKSLKLFRNSIFVPILGVNQKQTIVKHQVKSIISSCAGNFDRELKFLVVDKITNELPVSPIDISTWNIPNNIELADPQFENPSKIDALLGIQVFYELLLKGKIELGEGLPKLLNSRIGWLIGGQFDPNVSIDHSLTLTCVQGGSDQDWDDES
jgi:hypothetical protein